MAIVTCLGLEMYAGLTLGAPVGSHYQADCLEALGLTNNWMPLTNRLLPANPFLLFDPGSGGAPRRFYHATLLP